MCRDSYLLTHDKPSINNRNLKKLKICSGRRKNHYAVITARPDMSHSVRNHHNIGFSPEGQFALQVLDTPELPLVGFGSMVSAADKYGADVGELVKPSGFHALSAIATLAESNSIHGMDWAYNLSFEKMKPNNTDFHEMKKHELMDVYEIHVFEESYTGIQSVEEEYKILRRQGFEITLNKIGITQNKSRAALLETYGAKFYRV